MNGAAVADYRHAVGEDDFADDRHGATAKTPMLRVERILRRRTLPSVSVGRMSFSILKSRCLRATRDIDVPIVAPFGLRLAGRNGQKSYRCPGLRSFRSALPSS